MKKRYGIRKIPDGKLIKIELDYDETANKIHEVKITGDFFCYPENIIPKIEKLLKNKTIPFDSNKTILEIEQIISEGDLIGVSARDIVEVILEAIN